MNSKKLKSEYLTFLTKHNSLHLATIGKNGRPESSYAPFVTDQKNNFYVFVSTLSGHTSNMMDDGRAGIMLIESEQEAENIFARKRVSFECEVEPVKKLDNDWSKIMLLFDKLDFELMEMLRNFSDFHLFRLTPKNGLFVKGFGNAFEISGSQMDELTHLNPRK